MEKQERDVEDKSQAAKDHPTDQETVTALGLEDLPERNRRVAIKFPSDRAPGEKKSSPWALVGFSVKLGPFYQMQECKGSLPKVPGLVKTKALL